MVDFEGFGDRSGNWAVGVGEVSSLDSGSKLQRKGLGIEGSVRHFAGDDV